MSNVKDDGIGIYIRIGNHTCSMPPVTSYMSVKDACMELYEKAHEHGEVLDLGSDQNLDVQGQFEEVCTQNQKRNMKD